jgi:phytoene synthase
MSVAVAQRRMRAADPALAAGLEAARAICRRDCGGFYVASFFLPKHKRDASYAVGAFCRMTRDAIRGDEAESGSCCSSDSVASRLAMFRERLDELYAGSLDLPNPEFRSQQQHVLHAFSSTVERYEIPKQHFLNLADGYRMDLTVSRYATWKSLENYCSHGGGAIAAILSCVLGLTHSDAKHHAAQLGNASHLTRLLRDIKTDWTRGRVYLPLEDLVRFRYSEKDLAASVVNENFRELMGFEIARARQLYRDGAEGICWLAGDGSRLSASVFVAMHSGILDEIERRGYDVFSRPAQLSAAQKIRRIPVAWKLARRQAGEAMPEFAASSR